MYVDELVTLLRKYSLTITSLNDTVVKVSAFGLPLRPLGLRVGFDVVDSYSSLSSFIKSRGIM